LTVIEPSALDVLLVKFVEDDTMHNRQRNLPMVCTAQDLEKAVRTYRQQDLHGAELFRQWQAIRDAALNLPFFSREGDGVPGEDSY
jgi:hypothetical protein